MEIPDQALLGSLGLVSWVGSLASVAPHSPGAVRGWKQTRAKILLGQYKSSIFGDLRCDEEGIDVTATLHRHFRYFQDKTFSLLLAARNARRSQPISPQSRGREGSDFPARTWYCGQEFVV